MTHGRSILSSCTVRHHPTNLIGIAVSRKSVGIQMMDGRLGSVATQSPSVKGCIFKKLNNQLKLQGSKL